MLHLRRLHVQAREFIHFVAAAGLFVLVFFFGSIAFHKVVRAEPVIFYGSWIDINREERDSYLSLHRNIQ